MSSKILFAASFFAALAIASILPAHALPGC
jgi:hypothetical protein